jgi:hypothetical protein
MKDGAAVAQAVAFETYAGSSERAETDPFGDCGQWLDVQYTAAFGNNS